MIDNPINMDTVLNMEGINKTFPGVQALDNVDFQLKKGTVHILLGENGAGKSTLVKILSGAYQKTAGRIYIDGEKIEIRNPHHAQELGIGIIYQELNLIPQLTVAENIFLGREEQHFWFLLDDRKMELEAQGIIDQLGVKISAGDLVKGLGIAQQQMVEVAKALAVNVRVLIMDEPTSALTETEIRQLFSLIGRLKKSGVSIIYISHRMEELFEVGDLVTVLRDGKCIGTRRIAETHRKELIWMMVNRDLDEQYHRVKSPLGEEILRVENLSSKDKLSNINFSIRSNEIVGIAGLLGSGRTELARALFGADPYEAGSIFVLGKKRNFRNPADAIKAGMGLLTEDRKSQGLIMTMSVKENITLPSVDDFIRFGVVDGHMETAAADQHSRNLNIKLTNLNQLALNLSGGNQQKVVLCKWLCSRADIFIFDEPTRGIDIGSKQEFYRLMNELTAGGAAIIVISSDLPELLSISDSILVMHNGTIVDKFDRNEFDQEKILSCALGSVGEA